jgi:hypothetical protein
MTDFTGFRSRTRDNQDGVERGVWGKREDVDGAGSVMSIRGTGTVDEEVPIMNFGYGFNVEDDTNAEVVMLALGNDVNNKVAMPTLPKDKQHPWAKGTGGMQHPTDAARRIEFNGDETFLRDGKFVIGTNREVVITVDGSNVTITTGGNMKLVADNVDIQSSTLTHNGVNIGDDHVHSGITVGGSDTQGPH